CRTLWSGMRSASDESGRDLSHTQNISSMAATYREACEPFLLPSPKLARADDDSIIADLLADDFIR
ncbi:MAG TPA: hypothetical protein VHS30_26780, partial [Streptosporangiaceae bacterium]|nr:hypothetical protein [Streptosporangiaceae bacterium]